MESYRDVTNSSSPAAKIELFRSLFRGRIDVFPKRFESSRTGRSGYQPACENEWVRGICEKPRVKCSECKFQNFLPVTNDVVRGHLAGEFVAGVYPMLIDETCYFLAADFDGDSWQDDIAALSGVCREKDIPYAIERSRSG